MKTRNLVPATIVHDVDSDGEEEDDASPSEFEDTGTDTDDEQLQQAFEKGELRTDSLNVMLPYRKKLIINNETGLREKLQELKQKESDWIERMDVVCGPLQSAEEIVLPSGDCLSSLPPHAHDDFKREMLFFSQAQHAVQIGIPKLKKLGVKTKRPNDYFAQMVKSDEHMKRVQERLLERKEQILNSEKAKKMRQMKKMAKQIQVEVQQERQKEKRDMLNKVRDYQTGKSDTLDLGEGLVVSKKDGQKQSKKKAKMTSDKAMRIKQKRAHKNQTFGYGGKKKGSKSNDKRSFNGPMFGLRKKISKNKKKIKVAPKNSKWQGKKPNRPGKSRRQEMRKRKGH